FGPSHSGDGEPQLQGRRDRDSGSLDLLPTNQVFACHTIAPGIVSGHVGKSRLTLFRRVAMSPAIRPNPSIPVGRLAPVAAKRRPPRAPYCGEPPGLKPLEVRLLLFLGVGGAACLLALALIGAAVTARGERLTPAPLAQAPVVTPVLAPVIEEI